MRLLSTLRFAIKDLFPASFALVMATGILSIGAHLLGFAFLSRALFWLNNLQYAMLLLFLVLRLLRYFPDFLADLSSHEKGTGFFTLVAGSGVLGIQYVLLERSFLPAALLWLLALIEWLVLIY